MGYSLVTPRCFCGDIVESKGLISVFAGLAVRAVARVARHPCRCVYATDESVSGSVMNLGGKKRLGSPAAFCMSLLSG